MPRPIASSIVDVRTKLLEPHIDDRGLLTELFRAEWGLGEAPVQWNVTRTAPNVLRGVHCHIRHTDVLAVVEGELVLGLVDLRPGSPTEGRADLLRIPALHAVVAIPVGVAHGFYFDQPTTLVYGVSEYWDVDDELGCRWDDPALGLGWPCDDPRLSPRDREAGSLATLRGAVAAALASTGTGRSRPADG